MTETTVREFCRALPKADLHLHFEGSYRLSTVRELLNDLGRSAPPEAPHWLEPSFRFTDFTEFRAIFDQYLIPATGTEERVARHAEELTLDLAALGVRYAEVSVSTKQHLGEGLSAGAFYEALQAGFRAGEARTGTIMRVVIGLRRTDPPEQVLADLNSWLTVLPDDLAVAVDLQSDERRGPAPTFQAAFDLARDRGLRVKVHAGEILGPESVWPTVREAGVRELSHGVRAVEDPDLVRFLADEGVTCHVCPTSNVRLAVYTSVAEHPLATLLEAGVPVTLGADDPLLFGASTLDEYELAATELGCSRETLGAIAETSMRFAPPSIG